MRVLFLTLLLGFAAMANAQVTISANDMPVSGDTLRVSNADLTQLGTLDFTATGANYSWNFASLVAASQPLLRYKPSIQTPYAFYFLNTFGEKVADSVGFGLVQFTNIYNFYKKSSAYFKIEGTGLSYSGFPLASTYSKPDTLYHFPLSFGNVDSGTFAVSFTLPTLGSYKSEGKRTVTADGWGSITTPFGTYNALRVKSEIEETDSLSFSGINFGFPNNRVEYKWLVPGQHAPILSVSGTSLFGNYTPTSVQYRDTYRNLAGIADAKGVAFGLQAWPQPANGSATIAWQNPQVNALEVVDATGRIWQHQAISTGTQQTTLTNLPKGLLFVRIFSTNGQATCKLLNI